MTKEIGETHFNYQYLNYTSLWQFEPPAAVKKNDSPPQAPGIFFWTFAYGSTALLLPKTCLY
jgi:hypothetical protein